MKKFLLLSILLFLTGCATHTTPATRYALSSKAPIQSPTRIPKSIKIGMTSSTTGLVTDSIHYTKPNGESGAYLYSAWRNSPVIMIEEALFSTIEHSGLFAIVSPYSSLGQTDYLLESTLISFQHTIIDPDSSEGFIDISMRVIDLKTRTIVSTQRFTIISHAKSNNALGGIVALQEGIDSLNIQVRQWLETTLKN